MFSEEVNQGLNLTIGSRLKKRCAKPRSSTAPTVNRARSRNSRTKGLAALKQIQLSLGHASIQTTERYLGVRQDLADAPCARGLAGEAHSRTRLHLATGLRNTTSAGLRKPVV
jgi:hypothetical protein